jgi:N-acetylglucosamine kinase-like BadF-type ATPase
MTVIYGIDAGGTRTRVYIDVPGMAVIRRELGSINRAAVGETAARECLSEIFDIIADAAAGCPSMGWLATASIVAETARYELPAMRQLLPAESRLLVVSNDAIPMLFAPPLNDRGVVILAGTGSGFLGGDGHTVLQLGGHEYLGSDQGSAFDIGLQGLRAALRARDGIGPRSALPESLSQQVGRDIASEARRLATLPFPKQAVARLAPIVIRCWLEHDEVAEAVVTAAVESLVAGAAQIRRKLCLTETSGTVLAGGLITSCAEFASTLQIAIEQSCGPHRVTICTDPTATVLSCARRLGEAGHEPAISRAYLNKHVWLTRPIEDKHH